MDVLRQLALVFILATTIAVVSRPAVGQDPALPVSDYLRSAGLTEQAADIEQFLREEIGERMFHWDSGRVFQHAAFFAYILTVNGLTVEQLRMLADSDVDIVHAITADSRPLAEQSLLGDLVVVADVVSEETTAHPDDGFGTSTTVRVRRLLKGDIRADSVIIRQQNRVEADGREVRPVVGRSYLFILSNGVYRYRAAQAQLQRLGERIDPAAWPDADDYFVIYRIYEYRNGRVDRENYSRRDSARALEEIERVDRLLKAYRNE